jgi:hypothetical protein
MSSFICKSNETFEFDTVFSIAAYKIFYFTYKFHIESLCDNNCVSNILLFGHEPAKENENMMSEETP